MEDGQSVKIRTLAIIQARMTSSRLPGKVLLPLPFPHGEPLIYAIIKKLRLCKAIDQIVVVTSSGPKQAPLVDYLISKKIALIQGDEMDVISRFITAINHYKPTTVVRITADNPFIDIPQLYQVLKKHEEKSADYSSTNSLPYGMNIEVVSADSLLDIFYNKNLTAEHREHVTSRVRNGQEYKVQIINTHELDLSHIKVTVDTPQDYMRAALLFQLQADKPMDQDLNFISNSYKEYPYIFE